MSQKRMAFGKTGEDLACCELERRGYAIIARRHRCRTGELDIIARDGPTLVFVEVKARDGHAFGDAAEAVTWQKQQRIVAVCQQRAPAVQRPTCGRTTTRERNRETKSKWTVRAPSRISMLQRNLCRVAVAAVGSRLMLRRSSFSSANYIVKVRPIKWKAYKLSKPRL